MPLLDPRLLEIEILSEAERKTFAGGEPYQHRREGSVDREREEALLELVSEQALVSAESYARVIDPDPDFPLKHAARRALTKVLDFSETIIPLKITQRGRLRLVRLRDEILTGRDRIKDDFDILWARRHFEPDLTVHLRSREPGKPISLVLVDVDKLRDLNTDIGHPDATKVLIGIFEELRGAIHPHYGYRLGNGDEAGASLVGVQFDEAAKLGEEVRRRIEQRVWPAELKFKRRPTVSIGVGTLTGEIDAAAFYTAVDRLVYRAKETRNAVVAAPVPEAAG
jgi:diguanylate cyclase (GGDEF)-like protein